jgi:tRNA pseudouridine55 synthase
MFGLFVIDKPYDLTSRDVVNHVQRLVRPHRAGHAGTLDPLATGVLVVGVGRATRLVEFVQELPKHYVGQFLLGRSSETDDTEAEVTELARAPIPTRESVDAALSQFRGHVWQRPPAYSALKVRGQRAYALARRGESVSLQPRPVRVDHLTVLEYAYPVLTLEVTCGAGTYIRALGRDVAEALGTCAVMSGLQRRAIGPFTLETACRLEQLTPETLSDWLLPPLAAVAHLPRMELAPEQMRALSYGQSVAGSLPEGEQHAAAVHDGQLVAVLIRGSAEMLKPHRNFLTPQR